ncbi:MAG: UTP--glucose-1-phosphate uridylyltransferase [Bacteroidia bacterium]|nr:UTP--glucose-1-phosphate uridylyltransferase [Bacteroidia bacterium]
MNPFIETISSQEQAIRDRSFLDLCEGLSTEDLMSYLDELEAFRKQTDNLYERVRASLFLHSAFRFVLQESDNIPGTGKLPYHGFEDLLDRKFEQAIHTFHKEVEKVGMNAVLASALADAYHHLSFKILADQVRKSVRASRGNQWMFRLGHVEELPIHIHSALLNKSENSQLFPILREQTSVRMDLSHSGWSDIFFLGMDYPEGARVINVSVDLGVYGRDKEIRPSISTYFRVISEPVIRLSSLDLNTSKDISDLADLFNFGNDYLSLLKAGIIAGGLVPPAFEGTGQKLEEILARIVGPGMGVELLTKVNDIPKGSRFAVSTNLLGSMIALIMRATGQTASLEGGLTEPERRLVASRAILGEWLGGSGGGWQDSGGVWPGIKKIEGTAAKSGDPEFGISRGCLLPIHNVLQGENLHAEINERLSKSLVLMHGGMAQNVGPILEMVTEKYLLRASEEWKARQAAYEIYNNIQHALREGDIQKLAQNTNHNWEYPIKTIIPWASTHFTELIIQKAKKKFGDQYWGFLMLGGMSGGGMGMFVDPAYNGNAKEAVLEILKESKQELSAALPFAMEPVVYDFNINPLGTQASLMEDYEALMPDAYYRLHLAELSEKGSELPNDRKIEIDRYTAQLGNGDTAHNLLRTMVGKLFRSSDPAGTSDLKEQHKLSRKIKEENGFDFIQHEQLRKDLQRGRIGLSRNRLSAESQIEDVLSEDVVELKQLEAYQEKGKEAIRNGELAVLSLAGGVGSRWTQGAGVIKALSPFVEIEGIHRSFIEIHLKKTQRTSETFEVPIPHIFATSHLTHNSIQENLNTAGNYGYEGGVYLSPGRSIGQRFIPMERDLRFLWEEMAQETLDENKQKVQDAVREALIGWAKSKGEGTDYEDNIASQRLSPLGHWYEVSNLLRNGTLAKVLKEHPGLKTIMLHNIDTLGADIDPAALGYHIHSSKVLSFEVVPRRIEDRGGGLARVNGQVRLLEGLAQPREEDEFKLSYYNSLTTWIDVDQLLELFGLSREDLHSKPERIDEAVRQMASRMPTYVTIKNVKLRWGHGQEDIYPVAQVEKLWGDMSGLPDVNCGYLAVSRMRGQQLKDPAQLDAWSNDGSKAYIAALCGWEV